MDATSKHQPTEEQCAIIERVSTSDGNLLITALAGTGKTTTLEMMQDHIDESPRLYLAFAKRNVEEAEGKFPSDCEVRTFNSCGHRIVAKMIGKKKLEVDKQKTNKLLRIIIDEANSNVRDVLWGTYHDVIPAVAHAKALGYVPDGSYTNAKRLMNREQFHQRLALDLEEPDELTAELIDTVLLQSIRTAFEGYIDFNDQVYIPAVFGGPYPRFPYVMADEAQDLNPVNHAMLERLARGRFAAVGDDAQSIYEFRGAVQGGMSKLKRRFDMEEMTLSVSFRCPQAGSNMQDGEFPTLNGPSLEDQSTCYRNSIQTLSPILMILTALLSSAAIMLLCLNLPYSFLLMGGAYLLLAVILAPELLLSWESWGRATWIDPPLWRRWTTGC